MICNAPKKIIFYRVTSLRHRRARHICKFRAFSSIFYIYIYCLFCGYIVVKLILIQTHRWKKSVFALRWFFQRQDPNFESIVVDETTVNPPNTRLGPENFQLLKVLGKGGYGKVSFLLEKQPSTASSFDNILEVSVMVLNNTVLWLAHFHWKQPQPCILKAYFSWS